MIEPGKHDTEKDINKQLNDKERVFAALENPHLSSKIPHVKVLEIVNKGLVNSE